MVGGSVAGVRNAAACLLGGVSILASGCASTPELAASHPWLEATTPHFLIRSGVDAEQTKEIAHRLEVFRTAVRRLAGMRKQLDPERARVYVFRNKRSLEAYSPHPGVVSGYFFQTAYASHFALAVGADSDRTFRVIYHGYVHQVLEEAGLELPLWYEGGFAEILAARRTSPRSLRAGLRHPLRRLLEGSHRAPAKAGNRVRRFRHLSRRSRHHLDEKRVTASETDPPNRRFDCAATPSLP